MSDEQPQAQADPTSAPVQAQAPAPPPEQSAPVQQQPTQQSPPSNAVWGDAPTPMMCTNCNTQQTSVPTKNIGATSWIVAVVVAAILFFVVCWPCVPCAFLVLLIDPLKDTKHVCPNCNHVNGVKKMI
ncbi:Lipopolysaccharide-induced tumor necrosis factor-alpha factor-like [Oopsacas minuta]|uniref:Lipopolysaccharide-induced tumor necrosis factor-alpha factor-like n=1 Tax=Oopsacas minuta TaxID=111878 RepID=A0AAV7JR88_9METZ|nr:Lipopolysaccharide-induced tumor necrosis factor-alpha factor-like [Oopsacas minuta]